MYLTVQLMTRSSCHGNFNFLTGKSIFLHSTFLAIGKPTSNSQSSDKRPVKFGIFTGESLGWLDKLTRNNLKQNLKLQSVEHTGRL